MPFDDRSQAGKLLGAALKPYRAEQPIVLALPRGGVPVGLEVARALDAPLDVLIVRKLGVPWQPELGIGAVAEGGVRVVDETSCARLGISGDEVEAIAARELREVQRRVERYRGGRASIEPNGRTVIVVDDGVATGGTARAALRALRARAPKQIVFAVPVAAAQTVPLLEADADAVVALAAPDDLSAISCWYRDFAQVTDDEVRACLARARSPSRERLGA